MGAGAVLQDVAFIVALVVVLEVFQVISGALDDDMPVVCFVSARTRNRSIRAHHHLQVDVYSLLVPLLGFSHPTGVHLWQQPARDVGELHRGVHHAALCARRLRADAQRTGGAVCFEVVVFVWADVYRGEAVLLLLCLV